MDGIVQSGAVSIELHERIKQLLKESNNAKEKGQWKKAQDLLLELRRITRNIKTRL